MKLATLLGCSFCLVLYGISSSRSADPYQVSFSTQTHSVDGSNEQNPGKKKWIWWAVGIAVVAAIVYAIIYASRDSGSGGSGGGSGGSGGGGGKGY